MSVSFWLRIDKLYQHWRNIFHLTNTDKNCCANGDRIPGVWITPGGSKIYISSGTNSNNDDGFVTGSLRIHKKQFITIVWDGTNVYVYINGILNTKYTHSSPLTSTNSNAIFYIGDPWHGQTDGLLIKDFKLYNCPLSQNNISQINSSESSTSCEYQMSATELQCYKNNYPQDLSKMNNSELQNHWSTHGCNEDRNNQCSSQPSSAGQYNYKGCYNDSGLRAIPTRQSNVSSVDQCAQIAEQNNQNVFGVQYNGECWTGLNEQEAYQYGPNFNKSSCPTLGGTWTNQVYARGTSFPAPSAPVPQLTNPNFATKENFDNILDEEEKYEIIKNVFEYMIMFIIIILLFIFASRMLKE